MRGDTRPPRRHLGTAGRGELTCASVAESLPALADDGADVGAAVRDHVATCLRCQAEVARYRRLARNLRALRDQPVDPGPALVADILSRLDACPLPRGAHSVRSLAAVGGISAVTVAGAGMLVWFTRRRLALAG